MADSKEELKLEDVRGVGPKTADKLREKGIISVEQLAVKRPDELKDILLITRKAAKDITNDAKAKALDQAIPAYTFNEIDDHIKNVVKRIPTGSSELDKILGGGVRTEAITLLHGEYSVGKTQISFQLIVNCLKYLKRKIIWIETESGIFSPDRVREIAKASGVKIDGDNDIIIIPARGEVTPYNQFLNYERALLKLEEKGIKPEEVGLFVIDSFNGPFRSFYAGREMLPDRAKEMARHLGYLDSLASKYNWAVVVTGQVMDIPDAGAQLGQMAKTGHRKKVFGGNILTHWCTYIVSLHQMSSTDYEAVCVDAPDMPKVKCRFRIATSGIRDIRKK